MTMMTMQDLSLVRPFDLEGFRLISKGTSQVMSYRSHFSIHKGISQNSFLGDKFSRHILKLGKG